MSKGTLRPPRTSSAENETNQCAPFGIRFAVSSSVASNDKPRTDTYSMSDSDTSTFRSDTDDRDT